MRILLFLLVFFALPAQAQFQSARKDMTPYMNAEKIPLGQQYYDDDWSPADWIDDRGSAQNVIDDFYKAGIFTDQSEPDDKDIPVLEVGQPFLRLSQLDQQRVLKFFDTTYGVTNGPHGAFEIRLNDWRDTLLGLYTREGPQFQ